MNCIKILLQIMMLQRRIKVANKNFEPRMDTDFH